MGSGALLLSRTVTKVLSHEYDYRLICKPPTTKWRFAGISKHNVCHARQLYSVCILHAARLRIGLSHGKFRHTETHTVLDVIGS